MVEDPREFDPVVITNQARELSSAIVPLKTHVKAETGRGVKLETLDREIDVLEKLIQGFERISSGGANERDLVASFRPIRARAQRINRELQRVNLAGAGLTLWRSIEQQISDLETRFQIPREIVPRPTSEAYLLGQAPREQVNQALVNLEMSWRQLEDRMMRPSQGNPESLQTLRREVNEVVARTREQISKPR